MWAALTLVSFGDWLGDQPVPVELPAEVGEYRFAARALREIAVAMDAHPDVATAEAIGESTLGAPIWAFHVRPPDGEVERSVLVFAGIHALEWISTEVAVDLLIECVAHPPAGVALTVIPILNPDGRAKVEADLLGGHPDRYRRGNQPGVDLNRDFGWHRESRAVWRRVIPGYYATSPAPLSQPETRALDSLAARERYTRAASLHAFGGFLYYPWSGRWARPEDRAAFVELGRAMEQAQGPRAYRTRQLSRWGFFFRALGSEIDHLYGEYGTHAFLVELTRSGFRPGHLRHDLDTPFRWYNPVDPAPHRRQGVEAMRALIEHPPVPGEEPPNLTSR
jgi:hypothetical protein